jgi:hypothetical protein
MDPYSEHSVGTSHMNDNRQVSVSNKQKSSKIMKMKLFATLDKAKPDTENTRSLNLAAVMCMTVQVTRLSLLCKLLVTRA